MSRYIDAEYIEYEPMLSPRGNGMYEEKEVAYKDEIDDIPTADVRENVRGEWQKVDEQPYFRKHFHKVCCSVCRKQGYDYWNFCPNCGADMRGES